MNDKKSTIEINVEATGFDEVTQKCDDLMDVLNKFPPQVVVRNCRDCEINIHPSQTVIYETEKGWREDDE